jgi:ATP/maltotriose-dependent transcriptional regulator MalT
MSGNEFSDFDSALSTARMLADAGQLDEAVYEYEGVAKDCAGEIRAEVLLELGGLLCRYSQYARAIPYLRDGLNDCHDPEIKGALSIRIASCLPWVGQFDEARSVASIAPWSATSLGNSAVQSQHAFARAELCGHELDLVGAALGYKAAAQLCLEADRNALAAHALHRASTQHLQMGDLLEGLALSQKALHLAKSFHSLPTYVEVRSIRAVMEQMRGNWRAAAVEVKEGERIRRHLRSVPVEAVYLRFVDWFLRAWCGGPSVLEELEREISIAALPHQQNEPAIWIALTKVRVFRGNIDDAKNSLEHAEAKIPCGPPPGLIDAWLVGAVNHLSAVCDVGDKVKALERYDALVPYSHFVVPHTLPALELGRADSLNGRWEPALSWFSNADELSVRAGMKPYQAIVAYERGSLYERRDDNGDKHRARSSFKTALRLFSELNMPWYKSQATQHLEGLQPRPRGDTRLTDAEIRVAKAVAAGKTNRQIAEEFGVAEGTVKTQVSSIRRKSGKTRVGVVRWLSEQGLGPDEDQDS